MERGDSERLIHALARLRTASQETGDAHVRGSIAEATELLSDVVGPTVRPASAARLLGVSHTALRRWIDSGDVPVLLTPEGRLEVPVSTVVDLLEEVGRTDAARPLSRVIGRRRRASEHAADLGRLVPPGRRRGHAAAELHSLAYHRLVAERLDESKIEQARRRLDRWEADGRVDPRWIAEWRGVLSLPLVQAKRRIGARTPEAGELRQTSPFAGVLTEQERRRLVEQVEERFRA